VLPALVVAGEAMLPAEQMDEEARQAAVRRAGRLAARALRA